MARRPPGTTAVQSYIPREVWQRFKGFSLLAGNEGSASMTPNARLATLVAWAVENGVVAVPDSAGHLKLVRLRWETVEDMELQAVDGPPDKLAEHSNDTPRDRPVRAPGKRPDEDDTKVKPPRPDPPKARHSQMRRPEFQCHEVQPYLWQVLVALPDTSDKHEVVQDGKPLKPSGNLCRLDDLGHRIVVTHGGRETVQDLEPPLIFKTPESWNGVGRRVRRITSGYFLVIVPTDWKREGPSPLDPAEVTAPGYRAHYVHSSGRDTQPVRFAEHGPLPTATDKDILKGLTVFDDSDKGLLFGGQCPELVSPDAFEYAVVGEEGQRSSWLCEFDPQDRPLSEVLDRREGWFFLRLYDAKVALVASIDFRYSARLAQIRLNDVPYSDATILLPTPTGHAPARLTFVDAAGEPILSPVEVPPQQVADEVNVELKSQRGRVPLTMSLPRLWWQALNDERQGDWRATPFRWTVEEFHRRANTDTKLRLSAPRQVRAVKCGFGEDPSGFARVGGYIDIPLKEFLDAEALEPGFRNRPPLTISCKGLFEDLPIVHLRRDEDDADEACPAPAPQVSPIDDTDLAEPTEATDPTLGPPLPPPPPSPPVTPPAPRDDCDDFLVCYHEGDGLPSWDDARHGGFLILRQGSRPWPAAGSRVWVYMAGKGYVGVGKIASSQESAHETSQDVHRAGGYRVPVRWIETVSEHDACPAASAANRLLTPASVVPGWRHGMWFSTTIDTLKSHFKKWNSNA